MKRKSLVALMLMLVMAISLMAVGCATVEAPAVDTIDVEFAKDATLESVPLSLGFSWKNKDEALKYGEHKYVAIYEENGKSVETRIAVNVKPSATMVAEEQTIDYIENLLRSDAFKKDGAMYEDSFYDQYVMVLARSYRGVKADIKAAYMARVKDLMAREGYLNATTNVFAKPKPEGAMYGGVDYTTNTVMTLIALKESTVVEGVDLAAPFYGATFANPGYAYALNNNINVVKNLTIPAKYKTKDGVEHESTTKLQDLETALLATQKEGGSWEASMMDANWQPTGEMVFDVDTATFAMMALGESYADATVKSALDKVVADIKSNMLATGSISYFKNDSVSGTATSISGLAGIGIDAATIKNADSAKSLLDFLDTARIKEGTEKGAYVAYVSEDAVPQANNFSTKDAAIALISYNRYLRGEANFFDVFVK